MLCLISDNIPKTQTQTLVIPVCEDEQIHDDKAALALIAKGLKIDEFKGKKDDQIVFYDPPDMAAAREIAASE